MNTYNYKKFSITGTKKYGYMAENDQVTFYGDTLRIIKYKINAYIKNNGQVIFKVYEK